MKLADFFSFHPCSPLGRGLGLLRRNFFVLSLLCAGLLGLLWRSGAHGLLPHRDALLFVVMVMLGLEQHLPNLARQAKKVGPIVFSLVASFVVFPLWAYVVGRFFYGTSAELAGFVVLGAVPTTLTSAVIYTRLDKGNDTLALLIVLLHQLLCVLVTPSLVGFFLARHVEVHVWEMMWNLCVYFLFPLSLGMLLGRFLPVTRFQKYLARPEQAVVAAFVFMGAGQIPTETSWLFALKMLGLVMILQMGFVALVRPALRFFLPWDQTAVFYTSTQKTLSVGLYLLVSYFPSAAVLPMVLYHLTQLMIGRLYWLPAHSKS